MRKRRRDLDGLVQLNLAAVAVWRVSFWQRIESKSSVWGRVASEW